ncbi:hypothetical protein GENT11_07290 [Flavobacterium ammonificans]|uniref:Uncharacterized protein n=1 Tax=Flavobacterium ammonificans TaxID=1751056 RepID=A0ABM7V2C7_9FLAO|nr:hypothetical protein GENT11_07290 [Flavobacterium ammonificans]
MLLIARNTTSIVFFIRVFSKIENAGTVRIKNSLTHLSISKYRWKSYFLLFLQEQLIDNQNNIKIRKTPC